MERSTTASQVNDESLRNRVSLNAPTLPLGPLIFSQRCILNSMSCLGLREPAFGLSIQFAIDSGSLEKPRKFGVFTRTL
jgi:hypothetical protein